MNTAFCVFSAAATEVCLEGRVVELIQEKEEIALLQWTLRFASRSSFQSERRPHARAYVETAMRLGSLINSCKTADELGKHLRQPHSTADRQGGKAEARMESIKPELGPGLPGAACKIININIAPKRIFNMRHNCNRSRTEVSLQPVPRQFWHLDR